MKADTKLNHGAERMKRSPVVPLTLLKFEARA